VEGLWVRVVGSTGTKVLTVRTGAVEAGAALERFNSF